MDWSREYKREERASWEDLARAVRDSVTMRDVLAFYVPESSPRHRRIPCPLHNGKDYNFSFTDTGYKCFVCNEQGDAIEFVKLYCGLRSRTDAIKQINNDFRLNLPIEREVTQQENRELERRRSEARARQAESERLLEEYHSAIDRYTELDRIMQEQKPETPLDDLSDDYIHAIKNIDSAWYNVCCALDSIYKFDHKAEEGELRLQNRAK